MLLMNGTREVMQFDTDEFYINIINNQLLPFTLKDYIKSTENITSMKEILKYNDAVRNFFADRTLSISRENAKILLNCINSSQKPTTEERCKLSLSCRGVAMTDSFWVKQEEESITFEEVNLRRRSLSDVIFPIALNGQHISVQRELLEAEIVTQGMFRKAWRREKDGVYLWKSDKTSNYSNTMAELLNSDILDHSNIEHVRYIEDSYDGMLIAKCKCIADDTISLIDAEYVKQYCSHTGKNFSDILAAYETKVSNMTISDYLLGNTDRHINNWGFLIDSATNEIMDMAPLYDHNQALCSIGWENSSFDELIYEPTGKKMRESALAALENSSICFMEAPDWLNRKFNSLQEEKETKRVTRHSRRGR